MVYLFTSFWIKNCPQILGHRWIRWKPKWSMKVKSHRWTWKICLLAYPVYFFICWGDGTLQRFPYYVVVKVSNILYEEPMRHQRYGWKNIPICPGDEPSESEKMTDNEVWLVHGAGGNYFFHLYMVALVPTKKRYEYQTTCCIWGTST